MLMHLAQVQRGDLVLDPCAGIGTIPMQVPHGAVGISGDLVLTDSGLAPLAINYVQAFAVDRKKNANLVAWDASWLPLHSNSVDVVVSDLPFGQQCMSAEKLNNFLPLLIGELSRVLRPTTGRMVLLCGSYPAILEALELINQESDPDTIVWRLPCQSCFPVNIGGLLAWVVIVYRGSCEGKRTKNHEQRCSKLTARRSRIEQQRNANRRREDISSRQKKRFRPQA
jgi:hypothetical protein